jgi:hypothetical protein
MAIRTICFVLLVVIDAWYRWIFAVGAVFLPFVRSSPPTRDAPGGRAGAPVLPVADETRRSPVGRTSPTWPTRTSPQPPIADIGRSAARSRRGRCRARLLGPHLGDDQVGDLLVGRAGPQSGPRRSTSRRANRQLRSCPSAVRRTRSQLAQNGAETLAMTPTVCGPPSTRNSSAAHFPSPAPV